MAYIQAQVAQKDPPLTDGRTHLVVEFTGDAGEPPRRLDRYLDGESTVPRERAWIRDELARLNGRKTIADLVTVGQIVPPAAVPTPPVPTAREMWVEKAQRLARLRAMGTVTTSALLTAINALADDVRTSYQAWFIDGA